MGFSIWTKEKRTVNRSEEWIKQSFQPDIPIGSTRGYGYGFWIWKDTLHNNPVDIVAAVGNGDQRIYFDEKNDLLVVVTADNYNIWDIPNDSYAILKRIYGGVEPK